MTTFEDITVKICDEDRQRLDRLAEGIQWLREHVSSEQPAELETICTACMRITDQCKCSTPHWGIRVSGSEYTPTITRVMDRPGD